jgi:Amt family ammonium transporter
MMLSYVGTVLCFSPFLLRQVRETTRLLIRRLIFVLLLLAGAAVHAQSDAPASPAAPATTALDPTVAPPAPSMAPPQPGVAPAVREASADSGNTAWMIGATALVLLMTLPGVALFYGGMVRRKNVLSTMSQTFAIAVVVTLTWTLAGYSFSLRPGTEYIGGIDRLLLSSLPLKALAGNAEGSIPESVYVMFQLTFAIITAALIPGAFAERMKFSAVLWFTAFWSLLVYAPIAHWVWEPGGWLAKHGVLDYAGGTVVHVNAGVAGLVCALVLGPRTGFGREALTPNNLALTLTGAAMLWVGWFGFNAGSAVAADAHAGMAMLVTQVAAAMAAFSWMCVEWMMRGRPSALGIASGAVGGLVAITPASGFVDPVGALLIGLLAGIASYLGATALKRAMGYDDSLDVFGIHGIAGALGAVLTGLLAKPSIGGVQGHLSAQLLGVFATMLYSGIGTWIVLQMVDLMVGLRVEPDVETTGLDLAEHGEAVA